MSGYLVWYDTDEEKGRSYNFVFIPGSSPEEARAEFYNRYPAHWEITDVQEDEEEDDGTVQEEDEESDDAILRQVRTEYHEQRKADNKAPWWIIAAALLIVLASYALYN